MGKEMDIALPICANILTLAMTALGGKEIEIGVLSETD